MRDFIFILCGFLFGVLATIIFKLFDYKSVEKADDYVIKELKDLIKKLEQRG